MKKRPVPRSKYIEYLINLTSLAIVKVGLKIGSFLFFLLTVLLSVATLGSLSSDFEVAMMAGILTFVSGGITAWLFWLADSAAQKFGTIEPVVPITRHNIQELPAKETL